MNPLVTQQITVADLAARIRAEHEAVVSAMTRGIEHAMACGDLLIEAKAQLKHGEWLPWLRDECPISEQMAQRYMRLAKHRAEIEAANPSWMTDLTLTDALQLIAQQTEAKEPPVPETEPPAPKLEPQSELCEAEELPRADYKRFGTAAAPCSLKPAPKPEPQKETKHTEPKRKTKDQLVQTQAQTLTDAWTQASDEARQKFCTRFNLVQRNKRQAEDAEFIEVSPDKTGE